MRPVVHLQAALPRERLLPARVWESGEHQQAPLCAEVEIGTGGFIEGRAEIDRGATFPKNISGWAIVRGSIAQIRVDAGL
jgi:hypothetical protein